MKKFLVLLFILCVFVTGCADESTKEKTYNQQTQKQEVQQNSQEKSDNWVTEGVEKIAKSKLQGNFKSVNTNPDFSNPGKLIVSVYYKSSSSEKANYLKIMPIFEEVYNSDLPVSELVMYAEATLVTKDGKESNDTVMKSMMTAETAKKINWKQFDWRKLGDVLDDKMSHPSLPKEWFDFISHNF